MVDTQNIKIIQAEHYFGKNASLKDFRCLIFSVLVKCLVSFEWSYFFPWQYVSTVVIAKAEEISKRIKAEVLKLQYVQSIDIKGMDVWRGVA